ncbi:MAG: sugar ABC transporter permease [Spirochaetia bacterium]|nr:sugar ABC transporter permease [Spirochaetia bacterium]
MRKKKGETIFALSYILPSFVLIMIFSFIPIAMDVVYSFTKYNVIQKPEFVGLANFMRMVQDPYVWASLRNTIAFTLFTVPVQTILALVVAAILADKFSNRFGNIVRSAMFIPVIASAVLVGTLWSMLLAPTGPVNFILEWFGIGAVNWLGGKTTSLLSVSMATIWKNVGYFLVIFYAGIMDIPRQLYEAAEVDGATKFQKFSYVTVPCLSRITYLVMTLGTIWSFQVFDMVYTMTGGGPGLSTQTLVLTIYNAAFKAYNMGYASAIALLMFVLVIAIQVLQKRMFGKESD